MPASHPATSSLHAIRRSVAQIERSLAVLAKALKSGAAAPESSRKGRKLKLSPARKAALAIQGEYIGHMRHLGARDKAGAYYQRKGGGVIVKKKLCIRCGECDKACPVDAIYLDPTGDPFVCIHCGRCVPFCPHDCLALVDTAGTDSGEKEQQGAS